MIEYVTLAKGLTFFASLWQIWHFAQAINKLRKGVIRKNHACFQNGHALQVLRHMGRVHRSWRPFKNIKASYGGPCLRQWHKSTRSHC